MYRRIMSVASAVDALRPDSDPETDGDDEDEDDEDTLNLPILIADKQHQHQQHQQQRKLKYFVNFEWNVFCFFFKFWDSFLYGTIWDSHYGTVVKYIIKIFFNL